MESDRLNRWLTLGANTGVLIGIILLVIELDQNREMMLAQTRNEISRGVVELLSAPSTNVELAEAWAKVRQGDPITAAQGVMLETFSESTFRYWENVHYQHRQGLYDDDEFSKHLDTIIVLISNDVAFKNWWCTRQSLYSEAFIKDLNGRLDSQLCDHCTCMLFRAASGRFWPLLAALRRSAWLRADFRFARKSRHWIDFFYNLSL